MDMENDNIKVVRIVIYEGPRKWVEETVSKSIHGTRHFPISGSAAAKIRAVSLNEFPEEIPDEEIPDPYPQDLRDF